MRTQKRLITLLALGLGLASAPHALEPAEKAAELFEKGLAELSQGDFDAALQALSGAAKAEPANQDYRQHVALVHRVKQVRGMLEREKDAKRWEEIALTLRSFYVDYDILGEALALDEQRHAKLKSVATAVDLAEIQLELGKNAEAVKLLSGFRSEEAGARSMILLGIGLARLGEAEKAQEIAGTHGKPDAADLSRLFEAACLNALTGRRKMAGNQLKMCFEGTPADQLVGLKAYARSRKDLAGLTGEEFAPLWLVASKVKMASTCGKSSSCASGGASDGCSKESGAGCDMESEKSGGCETEAGKGDGGCSKVDS